MTLETTPADLLISVADARNRQAAGEATFVDATYFAASEPLDARHVYEEAHLPEARFFDLESLSRHDNDLPHMLPAAVDFGQAMGALGLSSERLLIIYDRPRLRSAPRAWWTLRYFGHDRAMVLDGGFDAWIAAGLPTESGAPGFTPVKFTPHEHPALVADLSMVIAAAESGSAQILDARPADRFSGEQGDGWNDRRGHIAGSVNIPASLLLTAEGRLKPAADLAALLAPRLDTRPIITTCGSGIAAATLAFALAVIGRHDVAVFDGSWAEWGRSPLTEALTVSPAVAP